MGKRVNTAVWLDKYNRWQVKVQKDGVRRTFTSSKPGRTGQREANAKADAWLDDHISGSQVRVYEAFDTFIAQKLAAGCSPEYVQHEADIGRVWLLPAIGAKRVEKVTELDLQAILDRAAVSGAKDPSKGLSKKSLKNINATMTAFMKYCRWRKWTTLNPEFLTVAKNAPVKEKRVLQPKDLITLFTVETTVLFGKLVFDDLIHAYRLAVLTGLRPGELIGLEWSDIVGDEVRIQRSVTIKGNVTAGKNENARRHFVLTLLALQEINEQRQISVSKRVFDITREDAYRLRWKRYCKVNGIPYITPYEMRHTFVSMMQRLPEGELKALVGHSKNMDTWGVYGHEIDGEQRRIAQKIEFIFREMLECRI